MCVSLLFDELGKSIIIIEMPSIFTYFFIRIVHLNQYLVIKFPIKSIIQLINDDDGTIFTIGKYV